MENVTLNYVWINAVRQPLPGGKILPFLPEAEVKCPIPRRYIEQARRVRDNFPDLEINIWMDAYRRSDKQGELSEAFAEVSGLKGVNFRGLREIMRYRENPLFKKEGKVGKHSLGTIWKQVDLARLLVLQHQMTGRGGVQIYSDFDMSEFLDGPEALEKISNTGFLFDAGPIKPKEGSLYLENRFIGMDSAHVLSGRLIDILVQDTEAEFEKIRFSNSNGWQVFCQRIRGFHKEHLAHIPFTDMTMFVEEQGDKDHSDYRGFAIR